jgi:lipoate-protein ligase A
MNLYDLGTRPGLDSMTLFHALAHAGQSGLVIVSPEQPYVSIGYFQRLEASVDQAWCRSSGLPLIRREVGGGTTLLDHDQIFYQLIFGQDNPFYALDTLTLYRRFSQPVIDTYADLGIAVRFKEVNDLVTAAGNKKISGEGGADIGPMRVFVGSILLDFDCVTMSRVFPAPNEQLRVQLLQSLESGMSTVRKELGFMPPRDQVKNDLIHHFSTLLGQLTAADLPDGILEQARRLEEQYTSPAFLAKAGKKTAGFKIAAGVHVYEQMHKAIGGRIFSHFEVRDNHLSRVSLFGDFTFLPKEKRFHLEDALVGLPLAADVLETAISRFITENQIDCPGVTAADIAAALTVPTGQSSV